MTMPACEFRLKWVACFSDVVTTPDESPNGVWLAIASASSYASWARWATRPGRGRAMR